MITFLLLSSKQEKGEGEDICDDNTKRRVGDRERPKCFRGLNRINGDKSFDIWLF